MKLSALLFGLLAQSHVQAALDLDHSVDSIVKRQDDDFVRVQVNYASPETCGTAKKDVLQREFQKAYEMASKAAEDVQYGNGIFYNHFFDQGSRDDTAFLGNVNEVFLQIKDSKATSPNSLADDP